MTGQSFDLVSACLDRAGRKRVAQMVRAILAFEAGAMGVSVPWCTLRKAIFNKTVRSSNQHQHFYHLPYRFGLGESPNFRSVSLLRLYKERAVFLQSLRRGRR